MPEPENPVAQVTEDVPLTPERLARMWDEASPERRLVLAESMVLICGQASGCFKMNHKSLAEEVERLRPENERLKAAVRRALSIPRRPAPSEQEGPLGRAYTRGWESVIAGLDEALVWGTESADA